MKALSPRFVFWLTLVGVLVAGGILGFLLGYHQAESYYRPLFSEFTPLRSPEESDPLIAPLLGYRAPEATSLGQYVSLNNSIQTYINTATASNIAAQVSVYFRDLNTSDWLGINQDDDYYPASLLKVPVMIAYYKEAETDPELLQQTLVYTDLIPPDPFEATSTLVIGQSYTVEELIDQMITNSDNGATFELLAHIDPTVLNGVYADLGIQNPGNNSATYQISNHTYALFFRILYNATYLDPEYSEKALEILSKATFSQGLVAGVPLGTQIAHKFGEHVDTSGTTVTGVELSDCGIVYYPAHPYLLCVMTKAPSVTSATSVIQTISAITYNAVAEQYATSTSAQ